MANVEVDEKGDVWSVGGDGSVYYFQRQSLLNCLHKKTVKKEVSIPSPFYKKQNYKKKVMFLSEIEEDDYTKIES